MKKYPAYILLFFGILSSTLFAQTLVPKVPLAVREGDFEFVKKLKATGNALSMDIIGSEDAVTAMMTNRIQEATGGKVKALKKGIYGLEGTVLEAISGNTYDYYFRVEEIKDKEGPAKSRITFFVSLGNYNFLDSGKYPSEIEASRIWLQRMLAWQRLKEIAEEEKQQQLVLQEEEKKQLVFTETETKLAEEQQKLNEEIRKLQEKLDSLNGKLAENKKAIQANEEAKTEQSKKVLESKTQLQKLLNEKTSIQR